MLSSFGGYKIFASNADLLQRCIGLDTHFPIIVSLKHANLLSKPVLLTKYSNNMSYENKILLSTYFNRLFHLWFEQV